MISANTDDASILKGLEVLLCGNNFFALYVLLLELHRLGQTITSESRSVAQR